MPLQMTFQTGSKLISFSTLNSEEPLINIEVSLI